MPAVAQDVPTAAPLEISLPLILNLSHFKSFYQFYIFKNIPTEEILK